MLWEPIVTEGFTFQYACEPTAETNINAWLPQHNLLLRNFLLTTYLQLTGNQQWVFIGIQNELPRSHPILLLFTEFEEQHNC